MPSNGGPRSAAAALDRTRILILLVTAALALGLIAAAPAHARPGGEAGAVTPTATAAPALITYTRTGSTTYPYPFTYSRRLPGITGVSATIRQRFNAAVNARVAEDRAMVTSWRADCYTPGPDSGPADQTITWQGGIYAGRYASVVLLATSNPGCGGVNSNTPYAFTLDLKTGSLISLSRFASANQGQLRAATVWWLKKQNPDCVFPEVTSNNGGGAFQLPALTNWTIASTGIAFWFERYAVGYGACGVVRTRVPWSDIVRPSEVGSTSVTSRMISDYTLAVMTVTGKKVVVYLDGEGGKACFRGVLRGTSLRAMLVDGTDYRKAWTTYGTGTSRRIVGYVKPSSAVLKAFPVGTAEQLC